MLFACIERADYDSDWWTVSNDPGPDGGSPGGDGGPGDGGPEDGPAPDGPTPDAGAPDACVPTTCYAEGWMCGEHDDGCGGILDCGDCTCEGFSVSVPPVSVSASFFKNLKLPVVGWGVGGGIEFSLGGQGESASCTNDCTTSFEISGSGKIEVELKDKFEVELEGTYDSETKYCMECNEDTCEEECTELSCEEQGFSLDGTVTYTKYLGMKKFKVRPVGPVQFGFKCGAQLEVPVNGGGFGTDTDPGTCEPCEDCFEWGGHGGLGIAAKVNCLVDWKAWRWSGSFGCKDCASIYGNSDFEISKKSGECGDQVCGKLTGKAGINLFAHKCIPMRWFSIYVKVGANAWGRGTTAFGGPGCGETGYDGDIGGWAKAKYSCPKKCVCCDGEPSPTCSPGRASYQGCCSSHGGVCDARCQ